MPRLAFGRQLFSFNFSGLRTRGRWPA